MKVSTLDSCHVISRKLIGNGKISKTRMERYPPVCVQPAGSGSRSDYVLKPTKKGFGGPGRPVGASLGISHDPYLASNDKNGMAMFWSSILRIPRWSQI